MRIKIEIDDQTAATTVQPSREHLSPPPELLAAAAALNATSAGPAPQEAGAELEMNELPRAALAAPPTTETAAGVEAEPEQPSRGRGGKEERAALTVDR